jgi:hypothetical protein
MDPRYVAGQDQLLPSGQELIIVNLADIETD